MLKLTEESIEKVRQRFLKHNREHGRSPKAAPVEKMFTAKYSNSKNLYEVVDKSKRRGLTQ